MNCQILTTITALTTLSALTASAQQTFHVWTNGSPLNRNWSNGVNWGNLTSPPKALTSNIVLSGNQDSGFTNGTPNPAAIPIVDQPWTVRSLDLRMQPTQAWDSLTNPEFPAELSGQEISVGTGGIHSSSEIYHQKINNALRIVRNQEWTSSSRPAFSTGFLYAPVIFAGPIHFDPPSLAQFYEVNINSDIRSAALHGNIQIHNNITGTGRINVNNGAHLRIGANTGTTVNAQNSIFRVQAGGVLFMPADVATVLIADTTTVQEAGNIEMGGATLHRIETNVLEGQGTISNGHLVHRSTGNQTFSGRLVNIQLSKENAGSLTLNRASPSSSLSALQLNSGRIILDNSKTLSASTLSGVGTMEIRAGSSFTAASGTFLGEITGAGHFGVANLNLSRTGNPTHTSGSLSTVGTLSLGASNFFHTGTLSGTGTVLFDTNSEIRISENSTFAGDLSNRGTLANPRGRVELAENRLVTLSGRNKQHAFERLLLRPGAELRVTNGGQLLVRDYPEPSGILGASGDATLLLAENPNHPFRARIAAADGIVTLGFTTPLRLLAPGVNHQIKRLNLASAGLLLTQSSSMNLAELNGSADLQIDQGSTLFISAFQNSGFTGEFLNGPNGPGSLSIDMTNATKILRAGGFSGSTALTGANAVFQMPPLGAPTGTLSIGGGVTVEAAGINNTSVALASQGRLKLLPIPSPGGPIHGGCFTGTYTQPATSRLIVEINDRPSRPSGYGRIRATGNISLNGILQVEFNNNFGAQAGDIWTIYETSGGTITGSIAEANLIVNATNLPPNTHLRLGQTATTLTLRLLADPTEPTDPPGYYTWASASGLTPANRSPLSDPDGDGFPNWREYLLGMNPASAGQPKETAQEFIEASGQPAVRFRIAPGIVFTDEFEVQGSADLGSADAWSPAKATFLGTGAYHDGFVYRDYRFHQPISSAASGFLRIRYKGLITHPDD